MAWCGIRRAAFTQIRKSAPRHVAAYGHSVLGQGEEKTSGLNNSTWPAKLLPSLAMRPPAVCKSVFLYRLGIIRSRLCPADLGLEGHHSVVQVCLCLFPGYALGKKQDGGILFHLVFSQMNIRSLVALNGLCSAIGFEIW